MKKILFPVLVAAALVLAPADEAAAQMVVNDPLHMGAQIGQFAKRLQEWSSTVQNYQVVKDARQIAGVTQDITGQVKDLTTEGLNLQKEIQADLRKVASIQDLRLSNPQELFARALSMSGRSQTNQMLPVYRKADRLRQALQLNSPQQDVNTMFDVFTRFGTSSSDPNGNLTNRQYQARREESVVSLFAAEEMMAKRKLAMAVNYYKIADEMTAQSVEMQATLKNPGRYAMTEGERMAALNSSNDNMIKAMQLREQGDRLFMEASQSGPAHQAAEAVYASTLTQKKLVEMNRRWPR